MRGPAFSGLPERFAPWKRVYERHRLWSADGTWERLLQRVQAEAEAAGEINIGVVLIAVAPDMYLTHFGNSLTLRSGFAKANPMLIGPNAPI